MRAPVVYESMYGNTRAIAESIAEGLREGADADAGVVPVLEAQRALASGDVDLVVVGGPTHAHGMSRASTREAREPVRTSTAAVW